MNCSFKTGKVHGRGFRVAVTKKHAPTRKSTRVLTRITSLQDKGDGKLGSILNVHFITDKNSDARADLCVKAKECVAKTRDYRQLLARKSIDVKPGVYIFKIRRSEP